MAMAWALISTRRVQAVPGGEGSATPGSPRPRRRSAGRPAAGSAGHRGASTPSPLPRVTGSRNSASGLLAACLRAFTEICAEGLVPGPVAASGSLRPPPPNMLGGERAPPRRSRWTSVWTLSDACSMHHLTVVEDDAQRAWASSVRSPPPARSRLEQPAAHRLATAGRSATRPR